MRADDLVAHEPWLVRIADWAETQMKLADAGHGIDHVRRVVENAKKIGAAEKADPRIFLPAAWMHDCIAVAKNSPDRAQASTLASQAAKQFLESIDYPTECVEPIAHCIQSHSFSAKIPCRTLEARVLQDADRLEAVGAIGLARCLMTGGSMHQRLYHPTDPFPTDRAPADNEQSVDHFFAKLLGLHRTMQTVEGREEASRRTEFLIRFLKQLASEIGISQSVLDRAIELARPT